MIVTPKGPHWVSSVLDLRDIPTPDLMDARRELQAIVQNIESQLGSSRDDGLMLPNEHSWRRSAKIAMRMKITELQRVNTELSHREHQACNKARDHRRAVDILADLVGALSYALPNDMLLTELVAEAKELLAIRETQ